MCEEQVRGMYVEISSLSKKKPDGPVNKFKLKYVNDLLAKADSLLGERYCPLEGFHGFDTDELPTASDVVFVLSQYLKNMDKFRYDHTYENPGGDWVWNLDSRKTKQTRRSALSMRP
jgi:hypothetical protein